MLMNEYLATFNQKFDSEIRHHLKNVYACLFFSIASAAAGAYIHLFANLTRSWIILYILYTLASMILIIALYLTPDNGKNRKMRLGMLFGFAFFTGLATGPILDFAIRADPAIIPNTLMLSTIIFAVFSGVALFAPDGKYLYLGATLLSALSTLFCVGLANVFFQSQLIFQFKLWVGLFIFCGFIVWDTQMIIEKRRRGDTDFIDHSVDLFIDFIQIFRDIIIIFTYKEKKKQKKRRD